MKRVPCAQSALAVDPDQAASIASGIGFPVALKISSPDVIHKTETAGVKVCLNREDEVEEAFQGLVHGFALHSPGKRLDGVMVQRMGTGLELIVGSLNDKQFGPVLLFGLGGIFAEAMKDVSFRLIPIEPGDAKEMINDLRGSKVLTNPRGEAHRSCRYRTFSAEGLAVDRGARRDSGNGPEPGVCFVQRDRDLRCAHEGGSGIMRAAYIAVVSMGCRRLSLLRAFGSACQLHNIQTVVAVNDINEAVRVDKEIV